MITKGRPNDGPQLSQLIRHSSKKTIEEENLNDEFTEKEDWRHREECKGIGHSELADILMKWKQILRRPTN